MTRIVRLFGTLLLALAALQAAAQGQLLVFGVGLLQTDTGVIHSDNGVHKREPRRRPGHAAPRRAAPHRRTFERRFKRTGRAGA